MTLVTTSLTAIYSTRITFFCRLPYSQKIQYYICVMGIHLPVNLVYFVAWSFLISIDTNHFFLSRWFLYSINFYCIVYYVYTNNFFSYQGSLKLLSVHAWWNSLSFPKTFLCNIWIFLYTSKYGKWLTQVVLL